MMNGIVFQIQKFCTDDGPGIRTTVFLKGCPLKCLWCHNPEGLSDKEIIAVDYTKCVNCGKCSTVCNCHSLKDNKHMFDSSKCVACGKCIEVCPASALDYCGKSMTVDQVMKIVLADKAFYKHSGGGLTLSGGEPLMQAEFALEILRKAKEYGIHTCVETSCGVSKDKLLLVAQYIDLFLCDVKETDEENHKKYIGISSKIVQDNIKMLNEMGKKIIIRCPIIPSVNDRLEHFDNIAKIYDELENVVKFQLMPYHLLGQGKSERYGIKLDGKSFIPPQKQTVDSWNEYLNSKITRGK